MAKKSGRAGTSKTAWELLQGGPLPKGLVEHRMADAKQKLLGLHEKADGVGAQMLRDFTAAQGQPQPSPTDPRSTKAAKDLFDLHQKLGKKGLVAPKVPGEVGGLRAGLISMKVTPPYDFAFIIKTPPNNGVHVPATTTAEAHTNGNLSVSSISTNQRSMGSAYAEVGLYFHPLSAGTLRVSANPTFAHQWWTNSLGSAEVLSIGGVNLVVYGLQMTPNTGSFTIVSSAATPIEYWAESETGQIRFDVGSDEQNPASAELEVSRSLVYLVMVTAYSHTRNMGWKAGSPSSLAGSMLSAVVPSISWEFEAALLLEQ